MSHWWSQWNHDYFMNISSCLLFACSILLSETSKTFVFKSKFWQKALNFVVCDLKHWNPPPPSNLTVQKEANIHLLWTLMLLQIKITPDKVCLTKSEKIRNLILSRLSWMCNDVGGWLRAAGCLKSKAGVCWTTDLVHVKGFLDPPLTDL